MIAAISKQVPIEVFGKVHEPPQNLSVKPSVWGFEMHRILAASPISLNVHTDKYTNHTVGETYTGFATNMRLFESTGTGACLLTDWKSNLSDFFDPDREVVTYKSIDECVDHPANCKQIALAGQQRTLTEHTLEQRANQLDRILVKLI